MKLDAKSRRKAVRAGQRAEALCAWHLRARGYRILARRLRTVAGEIDILARRGRVLAVIEVKARPSLAQAAEAIGARQRQRVLRAAEAFLARNPALARLDLRFDAMLAAPWRLPIHIRDAWRQE
ncbi:MAG: YraN family protein [Alphaproteobacteria bacterium]